MNGIHYSLYDILKVQITRYIRQMKLIEKPENTSRFIICFSNILYIDCEGRQHCHTLNTPSDLEKKDKSDLEEKNKSDLEKKVKLFKYFEEYLKKNYVSHGASIQVNYFFYFPDPSTITVGLCRVKQST